MVAHRAYAASAAGPADESRLGFADVREALRRGIWLILGTCALVTFLVAGYTLLLPTEYEAESIVYVETAQASPMNTSDSRLPMPGALGPRHELPNELGRLRYSEDLRRRVATQLIESRAVLGQNAYFPILEPADEGDSLGVNDVAGRLAEQVRFEPLGEQDMIAIVATSTVPEEAARVANLYAELYQDVTLEDSRASIVAARTFLEDQIGKLSGELDDIDDQVVSYSQSQRVPEHGVGGDRIVSQYAAYSARLEGARIQLEQERRALQVIQEELTRVNPGGPPPPSTSGMEAEIGAYQGRIADLKLQAEAFYANDPSLRGKEATVPELKQINERINHYAGRQRELESRLGELAAANPQTSSTYLGSLQAQRIQRQSSIRGLEAEIGALSGQVGQYGARVQGIPRQTVELAQLDRRRAVVASWYESFLQDLQRILVAEESEIGYVSLVTAAGVPRIPVRPNVPQNIVLGLLLGLGLGVGVALTKQATSQLLRRPEELEEQGYRVLGIVPPMDRQIKESFKGKDTVEVAGRTTSTRLLAMLDPWSPVTENFRLIRTNLEHALPDPPKVVLVTSSEMGAGKTVTSANLAVAMAASGRRTLLIDADLRRPSSHKMLGVEGQTSLSEVLASPQSWMDNLTTDPFGTTIDDLWFIPAGRCTVPPSELMEAPTFALFIEKMRSHFDAVIIDSPPVLVAPDSLLLARLADAAIIVVRAGQTDMRAIQQTRTSLESIGTPIAGTVVNRFDPESDASYAHGYSYGYAYGSYGYGSVPRVSQA